MNEFKPGEQDLTLHTQFQFRDNYEDLGEDQDHESDGRESTSEEDQENDSHGSP